MITHYASDHILKYMFGYQEYAKFMTSNQTAYLGLSATKPERAKTGINELGEAYTDTWNVTEPTADVGYARKLLSYFNLHNNMNNNPFRLMSSVSEGAITNMNEIHMNVATGDWGELKYVCIFDTATGGNLLAFGEIGKMVEGEWQSNTIHPVKDSIVVLPQETFTISID